MSLPYLGSKRKIVKGIYATIKRRHPEADILVDPFCGGFSVSEYFVARGWRVIANDFNENVVALLNRINSGSLKEKDLRGFVTRKEFESVGARPGEYEDWYVGLVNVVWRFGNEGGYIYGKSVEADKRALHELIVNADPSFMTKVPKSASSMVARAPNRRIRRAAAKSAAAQLPKYAKYFSRLEHLERIERIEVMPLGPVVTNLSYEDVEIPEGAVVYCDPPYSDAAGYQVGDFDSRKFWEWAREISKTNPIYISEYSAPEDFEAVWSSEVRSQMKTNSKVAVEKLFTLKS